MHVSLSIEFRKQSFRYIIVSWRNAENPSVELGTSCFVPGCAIQNITGLGPNARYLLLFYGSNNGTTKDVLIDSMPFSTGQLELNYACL